MTILKTIVTVINAILVLVIMCFAHGVTWKKDKVSVIGFGTMTLGYIASTVLMWI